MSVEVAGHLLERFTLDEIEALSREYGVELEDVSAINGLARIAPDVPLEAGYVALPNEEAIALLLGWPVEKAVRVMLFMDRLGLVKKQQRPN